jgi:hypothetical protein
MGPFAARALTGLGKPGPVGENIPALEAMCRLDAEFRFLRNKGTSDMGEVIVDLFLTNAKSHGQISGALLIAGKKRDHLLPNSLHV